MEELLVHIENLEGYDISNLQHTAAFWRHKGVNNLEQFDRYNIEISFAEAWKGCYGVKHKGSLDHFSEDELILMTKELEEQRFFDQALL